MAPVPKLKLIKPNMKILHTIEGLGAKFGGIATCTYDLLNAMQNPIDSVRILSPDLRDKNDTNLGTDAKWAMTYSNDGIGPFNYSPNLKKILYSTEYDIYHANGMWQYIVHETCKCARSKLKPYVLTPHGMLYPEAMRRSYWKKWPLLKLWFNNDILRATCIHATCETEMIHLRELGYRGSIALIGNPVPVNAEITKIFEDRANNNSLMQNAQTRKLGFLGRLHPRKNCEALLKAVALRPDANISVSILGSGDKNYARYLVDMSQYLGITNKVEFCGFVSGRTKYDKLAELSALFVPSDMENFGMIVPEALLVGTPVMASQGTPWKSLNEHHCGWWTENSSESIASVIDKICATSPQELFEMGRRGREMVLENFEANKVAKKMLNMYKWLLLGGVKPDFIYEN